MRATAAGRRPPFRKIDLGDTNAPGYRSGSSGELQTHIMLREDRGG